LLLGREGQIRAWVAGEGVERPLTITKIEELLARQGCRVKHSEFDGDSVFPEIR
jgi:hypothetical protein